MDSAQHGQQNGNEIIFRWPEKVYIPSIPNLQMTPSSESVSQVEKIVFRGTEDYSAVEETLHFP